MLDLIAAGCFAGAAVTAALAWRRAWISTHVGTEEGLPTSGSVRRGLLRTLVAPLAMRLRPTSQTELAALETRLLRAGRRGRDDVDRFLEERVLALLGGLTVGLTLASAAGGGGGVLLLAVGVLVGILGPDRLLDARAARRRDAVGAALPGAVDLLVTCLDAGLSLEQAIARVAQDLAHSSPVLAEELHITASEFDAGVALPDALRRLARRVGLDDLSAMCGVVAQAHALGAPIAHTLREYATASRRQRMSALEERAGKLSTQLTVPLALFLLPAAMLIILGPAALQLVRALR
jgi:tight adherence protein C